MATIDGEEREVKLAVDTDFVLPPLAQLAGVTVVDRGEELLHAVYWDSDELALAHAGVGLRNRNGVWAYKGRSRREGDALVREEVELEGDPDFIPQSLQERLRRWVDPVALHPVATIETVRDHIDVTRDRDTVEVVRDSVHVLDGARAASRFDEVEVEFDAAAQDLADQVVRLLVGAGAVVDATPKYMRALRALGFDPPEIPG